MVRLFNGVEEGKIGGLYEETGEKSRDVVRIEKSG